MDLHLEVVDDAATLGRVAADAVSGFLDARGASTVVPATGETPLGLYAELSARWQAGRLDPSRRLTIVQLDEYLDLEPDDRRSLYGWMRRSMLAPLGIGDDRVRRLPLDGGATACAAFDDDLEDRGGIDLAILGLGDNGHLGFNEPPSAATSPTRPIELTPATIRANARYWGSTSDVPTRAVTLGLRPLLAADTIIVLVSGERKHDIVHRALEGPVGEDVPASFLREAGANVMVIVDRDAWGTA